jgi:hypothetical protein
MSAVRIFTDEDVYGAVAPALRRAGIDAVSTPKAGNERESDDFQLDWATARGRVLITFNVGHFADLHAKWIENGRHHAGIVVSQQRPIGDVIRRVLHLAGEMDAESMRDRLEFLGDW